MTDFVLIEASKLCMSDEIMQHEPQTEREETLKKLLERAISRGIKDFYRPICDPWTINNRIYHTIGKYSAVGYSYKYWEKAAKAFYPKRHSRLGTRLEYVAFLGFLMKKMLEKGWSVAEAWDAVCNDSIKLGYYINSGGKLTFQPTVSTGICGFYDLGNTFKILAEDEDERTGGFWVASGSCEFTSYATPLANMNHADCLDFEMDDSTGWIIMPAA